MFKKRWVLGVCCIVLGVAAQSLVGYAAGWQQDGNGWWYEEEDGSYPNNNWARLGEQWYYFDQNGYMQSGWQVIDGKSYYFHADGAMAHDTWIDGVYYVDSSGKMLTNSTTPDGYYVGDDGRWAYPELHQKLKNTLCSEEWEVYSAYNASGEVPLTDYYGLGIRYMPLPKIKFNEDFTFEFNFYSYNMTNVSGEKEIVTGTYKLEETESEISIHLNSNDLLKELYFTYSTGFDGGYTYHNADALLMPISDTDMMGNDVSTLLFVHPSFYQ